VAGGGDGLGRVQIYTGDGKGKTTAALGLALRAAGAGIKVLIVQFLKRRHTSELTSLERLADLIVIRRFGREGFVAGEPTDEDRALAREGLAEARRAASSGEYGVVVLDEAAVAVKLGLFPVGELLDAIDSRAGGVEIVVTGRDAPEELVARADLVTEMRAVKHYFSEGVGARVGIEK
jgi:cob(I)alamin adenosyltransferase